MRVSKLWGKQPVLCAKGQEGAIERNRSLCCPSRRKKVFGHVEKESSLNEPSVRSKHQLSLGGKAMISHPSSMEPQWPAYIHLSNPIGIIQAFASCIGNGYREREGNQLLDYLLSNDIRVVRGLGFEGAVIGPEVNGRGDTGNASFVDL